MFKYKSSTIKNLSTIRIKWIEIIKSELSINLEVPKKSDF